MPSTISWLIHFILILLASLLLIYKYVTRKFNYWKSRGVSGPKPTPFVGNAIDIMTFKTTIGQWLRSIYEWAPEEPYVGIFVFDQPVLILKSPEIIKQVLIRDFNYFKDRSVASPKHSEINANMMFFQRHPDWKSVRTKVTPTFSSGKMKNLFPLVNEVGEKLTQFLNKSSEHIEVKEIACKYAIDVIAKVFFGINAHCLDNEDAKFRNVGRDMFAFTLRNSFAQSSYFFKSALVDLLNLHFFEKDVSNFFREAFWLTVNSRNDVKSNNYNFVDILTEARKKDPSFGNKYTL